MICSPRKVIREKLETKERKTRRKKKVKKEDREGPRETEERNLKRKGFTDVGRW